MSSREAARKILLVRAENGRCAGRAARPGNGAVQPLFAVGVPVRDALAVNLGVRPDVIRRNVLFVNLGLEEGDLEKNGKERELDILHLGRVVMNGKSGSDECVLFPVDETNLLLVAMTRTGSCLSFILERTLVSL